MITNTTATAKTRTAASEAHPRPRTPTIPKEAASSHDIPGETNAPLPRDASEQVPTLDPISIPHLVAVRLEISRSTLSMQLRTGALDQFHRTALSILGHLKA